MGSSEVKNIECKYCACKNYKCQYNLPTSIIFECGTEVKTPSFDFSNMLHNWKQSETCKKIQLLRKHKQQLMLLVAYFFRDHQLLNRLDTFKTDRVEYDLNGDPTLVAAEWRVWGQCDTIREAIKDWRKCQK